MRREELYLADLVDKARAVRGYLDGVARERQSTLGQASATGVSCLHMARVNG
jgi:hypothetical protein